MAVEIKKVENAMDEAVHPVQIGLVEKVMIGWMIWIVALTAALYLVSTLVLYIFQRSLLYFPDPTHYTPQQAGLGGAEEISLATPDGERVVAWYRPAPAAMPTLLYFHGNGGGLFIRRERIGALAGAGYGVFIPSYRGYSGSNGRPTEKALVADGLLAYDYLKAEAGAIADHFRCSGCRVES